MKRWLTLFIAFNWAVFATPLSVYFSPQDNLQERLIELIDGEKSSVKLAIYTFTNKRIAKALSRAFKKGVKIEIICDPSSRIKGLPADTLAKEGLNVYEFAPGDDIPARRPIMHHKFCLFEDNEKGENLIWTGSFNLTYKASSTNRENAVVVSDRAAYKLFNQEFEKLKTHVVVP